MKTLIQNLAITFTVYCLLLTVNGKAQIGSLDTSFHTGLGAQKINHIAAPVYASTIQSDGKIVFGGIVQLYNGDSLQSSTFRLNTNGSLDTSYHSIPTLVGVNGEAINALVQQSDGKIIAAGNISFSDSNIYYNRVSRFDLNGGWDTSFNTHVNPYNLFSDIYLAAAIQTDGKIILGGGGTNFNQALNILRLNTNGAMDTSFHVGTGAKPYSANTVRAIAIQADGKIIFGGAFTSYNGVIVKRIARLNTDGSLDSTFSMSIGANNTIETISIQNNGKIIIGGAFTTYNGTAIKGLARLNTDGTLDNTFNTGIGINTAGIVYTTIIQADGRIIIGGNFTNYNGISSKGLARININGSFDGSFHIGTGLPSSSAIYATSIQADDKIIIGGNFTTYNGTAVNSLARLLVTPAVGLNDTIKGTVYNDINNNCTRDFGEVGLPNTWVIANPGAHAALTDSMGNYAIAADTGTYIVTQTLNTQYANHCVTSQTVTLSAQNSNAININWADGLNPSISGTVYDDLNHNCVQDVGEPGLPNNLITITPGPLYATTDASGHYSLHVDTGSYTISQNTKPTYYLECPAASGTYTAAISVTNPVYTANFSDTTTANCTDLSINVATGYLRQCLRNIYSINYCNNSAVVVNNVTVQFINSNTDIIPLSSSVPWTIISPNHYQFAIGTMQPFECSTIYVTDSVSCNAIGHTVECVYVQISPHTNDCDLTNNVVYYCHLITTPTDPNEKQVAAHDYTNKGFVNGEKIAATDTLTYLINFQNVGTDTAFNVVVRDTLSPYMDITTVQNGASSYPATFKIYGNRILEWSLTGIKLTDSTTNEFLSRGFVSYTVKQKNNNPDNTIIKNLAAVYFDFNAPVITNAVIDTVVIIPVLSSASTYTICDGNLQPLNVLGASTYTWVPATGLTNATIANPTASPSTTTVYTVTGAGLSGGINRIPLTVTVTVLQKSINVQTYTVCAGQSITVAGSNYTSSGIYTNVLQAANTCDSVIVTNLTVNNAVNVGVIVLDSALTANASGLLYQWIDCNNGTSVISGQTNQTYIGVPNGSYAVIITDNTCADTSLCYTISATAGINKVSVNNKWVNIYPNPSTGIINIESEKELGIITIYNLLGEITKQVKSNDVQTQIDISKLATGVYTIEVNGKYNKVIKE